MTSALLPTHHRQSQLQLQIPQILMNLSKNEGDIVDYAIKLDTTPAHALKNSKTTNFDL